MSSSSRHRARPLGRRHAHWSPVLWLSASLLLGQAAWSPPVALAQRGAARAREGRRPSRADLREAKARFVAGRAAVEAGRWADAVENFERAYQLSKAPSALYNLAVALRALGRYREARDKLRELLTEHTERLSPRLRAEARRYLREVSTQVAVLRLLGLDPDERYLVRLDGRAVADDGKRPLLVEMDPGTHVLEVRAEGAQPFSWEGELQPGEHRDLAVTLEAQRDTSDGTADPLSMHADAEEDEAGLLSSPWLWVGVGAALVAVGVGGWWLASGESGPDPLSPNPVELDTW